MDMLDHLIGSLRRDATAREVRVGRFWTSVWGSGCGPALAVGPDKLVEGLAADRRQSR